MSPIIISYVILSRLQNLYKVPAPGLDLIIDKAYPKVKRLRDFDK
jgi:hypothetical protein